MFISNTIGTVIEINNLQMGDEIIQIVAKFTVQRFEFSVRDEVF